MKKWLVVFIIITIFGCTQRWVKPNTSDTQFQRDWAECNYYSQSHCNMNGFLGIQLRNMCMKQKGYYIESK